MEKYIVELTSEERMELAQLVSKGKAAARRILDSKKRLVRLQRKKNTL